MEPGSSSSSPNEMRVSASTLEVVILIGLQGAGKSTFRRQRFGETHAVVSKALLRSNRRPVRRQGLLITAALASGLSVLVDDTNSTVEERTAIISVARAARARVVGYYFESPLLPGRLVSPARAEGFDALWTVRPLPALRFDVLPHGDAAPTIVVGS